MPAAAAGAAVRRLAPAARSSSLEDLERLPDVGQLVAREHRLLGATGGCVSMRRLAALRRFAFRAALRLFLGLFGLLQRLEQQAHVSCRAVLARQSGGASAGGLGLRKKSLPRQLVAVAGGSRRRGSGPDHGGAQEDHQLGLAAEVGALRSSSPMSGMLRTPGMPRTRCSRTMSCIRPASTRDLAALQAQDRIELARLEHRDVVLASFCGPAAPGSGRRRRRRAGGWSGAR